MEPSTRPTRPSRYYFPCDGLNVGNVCVCVRVPALVATTFLVMTHVLEMCVCVYVKSVRS